jgi:hypothetical protein
MTATLTPREKELARHALGLPNSRRRSYRNRYFAPSSSESHDIWIGMVSRGLGAFFYSSGSNDYFRLTRSGALAALDPGEELDEEDFPNG